MHANEIGLAIKNHLETDTSLSYFDAVRLVDIPPPVNKKEIQILWKDYEAEYLDVNSYQQVIHKNLFSIFVYNIKPKPSTYASDNENVLMTMVQDVYESLQGETLDGLLFGEGIKIINITNGSAPKGMNIVHIGVIEIECRYIKTEDFENALIGRGYLYYGDSPGSAVSHTGVSWTMFGTLKIAMIWKERYIIAGADADDVTFDDTDATMAPKDLQIQVNHPIAIGYSLEPALQDVYSSILGRPTSGSYKTWRNREGSNVSPFTSDLVKAWKYEVTLPSGNKWIEFVPSGVMVPAEDHSRYHDYETMARMDFEIYPRENDSYSNKEEKMGYSFLEVS